MQSPEETFFAERIAAILVPLHMARHNRKWDSARSALIMLLEGRREGHDRINHMRLDRIAAANPETLAVGCPFCMTMMEGRGQIPLTGGETAHPRFIGVIAEPTTSHRNDRYLAT